MCISSLATPLVMAMPKRQEYQNSLPKVALIKFLIWLIRSDCWHLSFSINPPSSWQQPSTPVAELLLRVAVAVAVAVGRGRGVGVVLFSYSYTVLNSACDNIIKQRRSEMG